MDIVIRGLTVRYGEKTVLEDFGAVFPAGEITCVMGPSGCGKTTLLNVLLGLLGADSGTVSGLPERIGAVFQENRLCADFSAVSNLRMVTGKTAPVSVLEEHLSELGLAQSMHESVRGLSGGMLRRVALARAVVYRCGLLVLDEPFTGLDGGNKTLAMDYLLRRREGRTAVIVTHDPAESAYLGANVINMK